MDFNSKDQPNMEADMEDSSSFRKRLKDDDVARALYSAMCNQEWRKEGTKVRWGCSWRTSGGIVSDLRNQGEDYLDFYCSGMGTHEGVREGTVTPEIAEALMELGWRPLTEIEIKEEHQEVLDRIKILELEPSTQEWRGDFYKAFVPDMTKTYGRLHALAMSGKVSKEEYYSLCSKVDFRSDM